MKKLSHPQIFLGLVTLIFIVCIGFRQYTRHQERERALAETRLNSVAASYFRSKGTPLMPPLDLRDIDSLIRFQESYKQKAEKAVAECKDVSPLAGKIAEHFGKFRCSIFEKGYSKQVYKGGSESALKESLTNALEICFFSSADKKPFRLPSSLYWNDQWNAVMIQLTDWPDRAFAGLLLHELGHAYHSKVLHSPSAHAPKLSDAWAEEELAMHELEAAVFDKLSGGKYLALVDTIAGKAKGKYVPQILAGLEIPDLDQLDRYAAGSLVTPELGNLLLAQHMLVICCRYADKHGLGMKGKIALYRWLSSHNF